MLLALAGSASGAVKVSDDGCNAGGGKDRGADVELSGS